MNRNTVFQMCYLAILMLRAIKKRTNSQTLKSIYAKTMTQAFTNEKYIESSKESFIQAFEELMAEVEEVQAGDDASLDELVDQLASNCPTNVMDPNFSRWGTISAVAKVVMKHWVPFSFMAQNVVEKEKNGSYLHVVASKLVELMSSKADPTQDSPTHYTSLKWIVAFGDAFFDANMEWVKRHDPLFGAGSYGHISRLVPEHLFVMHKQLEALKNDGWKSAPEFAGFLKAVNGTKEMGMVGKGREPITRRNGGAKNRSR